MRRSPLTLTWLSALGALVVTSSAAAAELGQRTFDDRADLDMMRIKAPKALELFTRGEAALASGHAAAAAELFEQADAAWPSSAILPRRRCQTLTELGKRRAAIEQCQRAITNGGSFLDHRAYVAALTSGDAALTADELAVASRTVESIQDSVPALPFGHAAECDVARRVGDERLLRACTDKLKAVAPDHYETKRALAVLSATSSVGWQASVWVAFLLGALATVFHAARKALRRGALPVAVALAVFGLSFHASAAEPPPASSGEGGPGVPGADKGFSKWSINKADPMSSVPTIAQRDANPLEYGYFLMDLTEAGDRAMTAKDYEAAARFYKAIAKAVPDASRGFAKTCEAYEALGDRKKGLEYCGVAISLRGARLLDFERFARLILSKPGPLTELEMDDLARVNSHLQTVEGGPDLAQSIECELGVRNEDLKRLQQCSIALQKKEPTSARSLTFQFAYALARKDEAAAKRLVEASRKAGLPPAAIQKMEASLAIVRPAWRRWLGTWQLVAAAAALALAVGALIFLVTRRRLRPQTA